MAASGEEERVRARGFLGASCLVGAFARRAAIVAEQSILVDAGPNNAVGEEVVVEVEGYGVEGHRR